MKSVKITINYSEEQNQMAGNWISCTLEDAAISLDKNMRRRHQGRSTATFAPGRVVFNVEGADKATVEPLMNALLEHFQMKKLRVLISYESPAVGGAMQ